MSSTRILGVQDNRSTAGAPQTQLLSQDLADRVAVLQEAGKAILNGFFISLRMAGLYDASNAAFQKPVLGLKARLDSFFGEEKDLRLVFSEGQVYLNDVRLKVDASSFEWVSGFVDFFAEREVGGLKITRPPSKESLFEFFQILAKLPKAHGGTVGITGGMGGEMLPGEVRQSSPRDILIKLLADKGISEFVPMGMMVLSDSEDDPLEQRRALVEAVGMYIEGILSLKYIATATSGRGTAASLLQMTRVAQGLADAEGEIGGDLLSLVTIKNCEHYLLSHLMNVCILSIVMGKRLLLSKEDLCDLALGAMLHDIGKLTAEGGGVDYQRHPYESFKFLMKQGEVSRSMLNRALIGLDHHLAFDGESGFPAFRRGQKPILQSRIVAIADAYDCLTAPGGDGKTLLPDLAVRSILKNGGTIFDPVLVQLFAETVGKYPVGTLVELDTGDIGIVVKSGRSRMRVTRPIVLLVKDRYGVEIKGERLVDTAERHAHRKAYRSSVVCSHDPAKFGINVSGFLIDFLSGKNL